MLPQSQDFEMMFNGVRSSDSDRTNRFMAEVTEVMGMFVGPMPSLLLLIDCCIIHEWLKEINYILRDK